MSAGMKTDLRDIGLAPVAEFAQLGIVHRVDALSAGLVPFEDCDPVREFPSWPGKRNYDGKYWFQMTGEHVVFESLAERAVLVNLDRDPDVVRVSSQPMWLRWPKPGDVQSHAPDFFARLRNGDGLVIDVRPEARIDEETQQVFDLTAKFCEEAGLQYRVLSDEDAMHVRNLRFLSRYRMREFDLSTEATTALGVRHWTIRTAATALGGGDESRGLGMVYRLIWEGTARVNLSLPLRLDSPLDLIGGVL